MENSETITHLAAIYRMEETYLKGKNDPLCFKVIDGNEIISYETLELMQKIYSFIQHDINKQKEFIDYVISDLVNSEENCVDQVKQKFNSTSRLSFYFLFSNEMVQNALDNLSERIKSGKTSFLIILSLNYLNVAYNLDFDQLIKLEQLIKNHKTEKMTALNRIIGDNALTKIARFKYQNIQKKYSDLNIEINNDKTKLKNWFDEYGFNKRLSEFLNHIDEYLYSDNKVVISGIISGLRQFMLEFIEELGNKLLVIHKEALPEYEKGMQMIGRYRKYLKEKLSLSDSYDSFLNKFVKILHDKGGHEMFSEKEDLRVTRNIGIEIVLFILSKYKKKYH